jgi:UTP:GlnB (protein PII) uridylyltransferase
MTTASAIVSSVAKRHTLIVEDEASIRELVRLHLTVSAERPVRD